MNEYFERTIQIGPLTLCFCGDESLLSQWVETELWANIDGEGKQYRIRVDRIPSIEPAGELLYDYLGIQVYRERGREYRCYYHSVDPMKRLFARSRQVEERTVLLSFLKDYHLATQSLWSMIGIEHLLLQEEAFMLHSASVICDGQAVLFSAPSGTGKSTQADLWKAYAGATGFNGDRNLIWRRDGKWVVAGCPWHGTSPDCINTIVPLRVIAVLSQAKEDRVRALSPLEKMIAVQSEATVNRWNAEDVEGLMDLIEKLIAEVDVTGLDCTMNVSAVAAMLTYLEGTTNGNL